MPMQSHTELVGEHKTVILESNQRKLTWREVATYNKGKVTIKAYLKDIDDQDEARSSTDATFVFLVPDDDIAKIKQRVEERWESTLRDIGNYKQEVADYIGFKTRGAGNDHMFYEVLTDAIFTSAPLIVSGGMGLREGKRALQKCHEDIRLAVGDEVNPIGRVGLDPVESEMVRASQALHDLQFYIERMTREGAVEEDAGEGEGGFSLETKPSEVRHAFELFGDPITLALQQMDQLWWEVAKSDQPLPVQERGRILASIKALLTSAQDPYETLVEAVTNYEEGGEAIPELDRIVKGEMHDDAPGLFPTLQKLYSMVAREEVLRPMMEEGRGARRRGPR